MSRRVWRKNSACLCLAGIALALAVCSGGCSPQETLQYADAEKLAEIPERHREQVRRYLLEYYGAPDNPKLLVPALEQDESTDTVKLEDRVDRARLRRGADVYRLRCAGCHGVTGNGRGDVYAYLDPKPRDYRKGIFKFKSTEYGAKPRRADLERVVRVGARGTSMPSFRWLADEDLEAVIDYVILLSRRGELELALIRESEIDLREEDDYDPFAVADFAAGIDQSWNDASDQIVRPLVPEPAYSEATVLAGAKLFVGGECKQCHGRSGRGGKENYTASGTAEDAWGHVAYAADLTSGMLHGGRRPIDIYRRIYSGIDGSPMSGFGKSPPYSENPEMIWHLTHFVLSLMDGDRFPEVQALLDGETSVEAADPAEGLDATGGQ